LFSLFVFKGVSLVPNTLLQNAIVEEDAMDLVLHVLNSTDYIDIKVKNII